MAQFQSSAHFVFATRVPALGHSQSSVFCCHCVDALPLGPLNLRFKTILASVRFNKCENLRPQAKSKYRFLEMIIRLETGELTGLNLKSGGVLQLGFCRFFQTHHALHLLKFCCLAFLHHACSCKDARLP